MIPSKIHPGRHLKELLKQNRISQSKLAKHIDVKVGVINEICNYKRGISVIIAQKLAMAFDSSVEFWLKLQLSYELGKSKKVKKIAKLVGSEVA